MLAFQHLVQGTSSAAFDYLSSSFHQGDITGMDVCIRKPIIATCSLDKSIRVWNYENKLANIVIYAITVLYRLKFHCLFVVFPLSSLDLYKEFQEEAYSVAVHPSGLFILVGFSEKLRLMNLLIDDIRFFKEFVIRGCREVQHRVDSVYPSFHL